ncbi:hypothetical protein OSSY52_12740 [Tepiditoga spiralis]|uniref:Uncharacterized protein n=1 Tax=Tepiditoga spiralis TaxID=2108365 RepID=A0A7G1G895_9BACT|nr:hypothetical protein [Tepiditoga spiralis]BBE31133.1 hypothetical protein OSSY52_12740 [Tepiditoga spiralis]
MKSKIVFILTSLFVFVIILILIGFQCKNYIYTHYVFDLKGSLKNIIENKKMDIDLENFNDKKIVVITEKSCKTREKIKNYPEKIITKTKFENNLLNYALEKFIKNGISENIIDKNIKKEEIQIINKEDIHLLKSQASFEIRYIIFGRVMKKEKNKYVEAYRTKLGTYTLKNIDTINRYTRFFYLKYPKFVNELINPKTKVFSIYTDTIHDLKGNTNKTHLDDLQYNFETLLKIVRF